MPRLAVGTAGWCLLIVVVVWLGDHAAPIPTLLALTGGIWLGTMMIRFDVVAFQFGRRIRYEIVADQFHAYRGSKLVAWFEFSQVTEWVAASSADTFFFWLGWGYSRSGGFASALSRYSFKVVDGDGNQPRTITPPALFRWADRGGLEDVTRTLIKRLGPPLNYSINYSLDDVSS